MVNHYAELGIENFASLEQIKKSYRRIALKTHPDRTGGDEELTELFLKAQQAYLFLLDGDKKSVLDEYLKSQPTTAHGQTGVPEDDAKAEGQSRKTWNYKSGFDRSRKTEPIKPEFGFQGERVREKADFFWYPNNIGEILFGHTDLTRGFKLPSSQQIRRRAAMFILVSFAFWGFTLLFSPNIFWKVVWLVLPLGITFWLISGSSSEVFGCLFVGVNGFARATNEISRQESKISDEVDIPFSSISSIYFSRQDFKISWRYDHSEFFFTCYDEDFNSLHHYFEEYNKEEEAVPYNLSFYQKAEKFWTAFCLDKLEENLEKEGSISFYQLDEEFQHLENVIKLSYGEIQFEKGESYNLSDLGRVYLKGSKLYFESRNFKKAFFSSTGSRDFLDLSRLSNRKFFIAALEILTGYKV